MMNVIEKMIMECLNEMNQKANYAQIVENEGGRTLKYSTGMSEAIAIITNRLDPNTFGAKAIKLENHLSKDFKEALYEFRHRNDD